MYKKTEGNDNLDLPIQVLVCLGAKGSCPTCIKVLAKSRGCPPIVTPSFKAIWGQESCNTSMVLSPEDQPVDAAAMSSLKFRIDKISQNIFKNYRFSCLFWFSPM